MVFKLSKAKIILWLYCRWFGMRPHPNPSPKERDKNKYCFKLKVYFMNILIVEDEELAVKKIKKTLAAVDETAVVQGETDSIESTVQWLEKNTAPDLILM